MLIEADKNFLTLEREQRAQFRAQAHAQSQPEMEEDEIKDEIEDEENEEDEIEEIAVSEPVLNHLPLERNVEETSSIVITPQQKQEQALELLKSAFEQIKLALSLLNDQKLKEEIETMTQTLAPVAEESVVSNAKETFASKLKKPVVAIKATEPVAPKAKKPVVVEVAPEPVVEVAPEPVAIKASETVAIKATEPVAIKATEPVVIKATEPVAIKATEPVAIKATEPVAIKATEPVAIKASVFSAQKTKKPTVKVAAEPVSSVAVESLKDNEDFQVVLPKKSKNKSADAPIAEKKDDFPSLGSSSSPVQKKGFWSSGKSSLEIAKTVAQKPSPPPIRSSALLRIISAGSGSIGPIDDEEEDDYDDEFSFRKVGDENDYWQ
jgi:hypothetical protein